MQLHVPIAAEPARPQCQERLQTILAFGKMAPLETVIVPRKDALPLVSD